MGSTVVNGEPTTRIDASPDPHRGAGALATVLGHVRADVVAGACTHVPVAREDVGADGLVTDPATRSTITTTLSAPLSAHRPGLARAAPALAAHTGSRVG